MARKEIMIEIKTHAFFSKYLETFLGIVLVAL